LTLIPGTPKLQWEPLLEILFVKIVMNGEPREIEPGTTVARLLDVLEMQPRYLAVERNFELVPRTRHAECVLAEGDKLEIVTLVGGG
jgi:thiamine biosynthesis protein ThiS